MYFKCDMRITALMGMWGRYDIIGGRPKALGQVDPHVPQV